MTVYCDTSLLVAAFLPEKASAKVHEWLGAQKAGCLFISDWSITEFSSALSIKLRSGDVNLDQRAEVLSAWTAARHASFITLPLLPEHFAAAAIYVERAELGLRAGDAVHLAVAAANACAMATLDQIQGRAAVELGIPLAQL